MGRKKKETKKVKEVKEILKETNITEEEGGVANAGLVEEELNEELVLGASEELVLGDSTTRGLDISSYQSGISLKAVKDAGYSFVILRAGYTG